MRWLSTTTVVLCTFLVLAADTDGSRTFTFSKADADNVPKGWKSDKTGKGEGSVWVVVADNSAPSKKGYVLAQTSPKGSGQFFNLCVAEDTKYTDLEASVAFKAIRGKED